MQKSPFIKELNDLQIRIVKQEFYNFAKRVISGKCKNHRGDTVVVNKSNFDEVFGFAYVSSTSYAIITLDTNELIKVGDYSYSHLAVNNEGVFVELIDSEENYKQIQISYIDITKF